MYTLISLLIISYPLFLIDCFRCLTLRSTGVIQKWKAKYWPVKLPCNRRKETQPVLLSDLQSILTVLIIAMFVAFFVLLLEFLWFYLVAPFIRTMVINRKEYLIRKVPALAKRELFHEYVKLKEDVNSASKEQRPPENTYPAYIQPFYITWKK